MTNPPHAAGIPVECGADDTPGLVLKNEAALVAECGHRVAIRQQVECMQRVAVLTSPLPPPANSSSTSSSSRASSAPSSAGDRGNATRQAPPSRSPNSSNTTSTPAPSCAVTFTPTRATGSVCPGFPCDAFSWSGRSTGGSVLRVTLTANAAAICSYLAHHEAAAACGELLPLCANASRVGAPPASGAASSRGGGGGLFTAVSGSRIPSTLAANGSAVGALSPAAAVAAGLFHCEADTVFARPEDVPHRISVLSLVLSVVLGVLLVAVCITALVCWRRRWRNSPEDAAAAAVAAAATHSEASQGTHPWHPPQQQQQQQQQQQHWVSPGEVPLGCHHRSSSSSSSWDGPDAFKQHPGTSSPGGPGLGPSSKPGAQHEVELAAWPGAGGAGGGGAASGGGLDSARGSDVGAPWPSPARLGVWEGSQPEGGSRGPPGRHQHQEEEGTPPPAGPPSGAAPTWHSPVRPPPTRPPPGTPGVHTPATSPPQAGPRSSPAEWYGSEPGSGAGGGSRRLPGGSRGREGEGGSWRERWAALHDPYHTPPSSPPQQRQQPQQPQQRP